MNLIIRILQLCLFMFIVACYWTLSAEPESPEVLPLTVEQTLGFATIDLPINMNNAYNGVNQQALFPLRKLIRENHPKLNKLNVCDILGRIGDQKDIPYIISDLKDVVPTAPRYIWYALGFMAKRGIQEANAILDEAMTAKFWDDRKLYMYSAEVIAQTPEVKYGHIFNDVVIGKIIAGRESASEIWAKIYADPALADYKKAVEEKRMRVLDLTEIRKSILSGKETNDERTSRPRRPANDKILKILDNAYLVNIKNINTIPKSVKLPERKDAPSENSADFQDANFLTTAIDVNEIIVQAQQEYAKFAEGFATLPVADIAEGLLDNGKPLLRAGEKFNATNREFLSAWEIEKKIFTELQKIKIKEYLNPTVEIKMEVLTPPMRLLANPSPSVTKSKANKTTVDVDAKIVTNNDNENVVVFAPDTEIKLQRTVLITFELPDTAKIAKQYFPNGSPTKYTIADSGNLKVYLLKINDNWYWNPFGW